MTTVDPGAPVGRGKGREPHWDAKEDKSSEILDCLKLASITQYRRLGVKTLWSQ
jgi:hypothetical protein